MYRFSVTKAFYWLSKIERLILNYISNDNMLNQLLFSCIFIVVSACSKKLIFENLPVKKT